MKKPVKSDTKAPAPASKTASPAPAKKPAPAAAKLAAPPAQKTAPAVPRAAAPVAAPAAPAPKAKGSRVTLIAQVDVGFGNALYVRGDEPYLNWDRGLPLGNISNDRWEIVLTGVERPFQFKFLRNNEAWSAGENFTAAPGDTVTLKPVF